jgi:phosphatidylglycerophosphatase C
MTVMFDLDHTLVRCDSFAGFNRRLLLNDWWRAALTIAASPAILLLWSRKRTRSAAVSTLLWIGTIGQSGRLDELMSAFVARQFANRSLVCAEAVEQLQRHVREGDRVVVVTGAAESLARRVCARIGCDGVEVVGSTLRLWHGGWVGGESCKGEAKIRMLAGRRIEAPWDCVYTDSASDLPLLRLARRKVLVNPRPRSRARVAEVLGTDVEVVVWEG